MATGNIAARNAPTRLGLLWWIVNPVIMTAIYFVVFGLILGGARGNPVFLSYLVGGILMFRLTSQGINSSTGSILGNAKLVTNIPFPRLTLPISSVLEELIGFVVAFFVIFAILMPVADLPFTWGMLILPLVVLLHAVFTLGVGALLARFAVQFRDIKNLIPHLTRIWFYLSPILWEMSRVETAPPIVLRLIELNPMFPFLNMYRTVTLGWDFSMGDLLAASAWTVGMVVIGLWVFWRFDDRMARYL